MLDPITRAAALLALAYRGDAPTSQLNRQKWLR